MLIGVPKETKSNEGRVGLTPASVRELARHGHELLVESGAGAGIGCADEDYFAAGAKVVDSAGEVFNRAELVVKVKEPQRPRSRCCATARCCSPTCTWPRTASRPAGCSPAAAPPSPTRPSPTIRAACRCSRR